VWLSIHTSTSTSMMPAQQRFVIVYGLLLAVNATAIEEQSTSTTDSLPLETLSTTNFFYMDSSTNPAPVPPACNIQTQICITSFPPSYQADTVGKLPRPFKEPSCSVSYTTPDGSLTFPDVAAVSGSQVPCAPNSTTSFKTAYGNADITYRSSYAGLPADPWLT